MQTLMPHEIVWLTAANTLPPAERLKALDDIADMARISLREVTHYAESMRILAGEGSAWGPGRITLLPARTIPRGKRPLPLDGMVFKPTMRRLMASK